MARAPLHLIRIGLETAALSMAAISDLPGGLIANPPVVDPDRSIAVGYDSGNGVLRAFDVTAEGILSPRWQRRQEHGGHLLLSPDPVSYTHLDVYKRQVLLEGTVVTDALVDHFRHRLVLPVVGDRRAHPRLPSIVPQLSLIHI